MEEVVVVGRPGREDSGVVEVVATVVVVAGSAAAARSYRAAIVAEAVNVARVEGVQTEHIGQVGAVRSIKKFSFGRRRGQLALLFGSPVEGTGRLLDAHDAPIH